MMGTFKTFSNRKIIKQRTETQAAEDKRTAAAAGGWGATNH